MSTLVAWIQQLGFLVFFAGLAQILLPDNDLRKVARLVIGLVLILAVIEPVVGWLNGADSSASSTAEERRGCYLQASRTCGEEKSLWRPPRSGSRGVAGAD